MPGTSRVCTLCKVPFMILFNPKMTCSLCRREICKKCSKTYNKELFCRICSRDISYRAMICNWFYETSNASPGYASDTIVRSLFKDKLQGKVYTPDVLRKNQNDQIIKFGKRYQEIRNNTMKALSKVRTNSAMHTPEEVDKEIDKITQQFTQQTKEALRKLLQMLCITEESK
ncbi:unnamed protein product [Hymenolepis diminuta]|uniref:FYVE-type zinc finger domain-containing protein n=1 Tax=Hymenolepis diminuta TaxID=6216 RepID=A0A3P6ZT65_HYMDI|nr:unnamed protein product [Hymenolepis diminuta]